MSRGYCRICLLCTCPNMDIFLPSQQPTKSHNFIMHILKNTYIFLISLNILKWIVCLGSFLWKLQERGKQDLEGVVNLIKICLIHCTKAKVQNQALPTLSFLDGSRHLKLWLWFQMPFFFWKKETNVKMSLLLPWKFH